MFNFFKKKAPQGLPSNPGIPGPVEIGYEDEVTGETAVQIACPNEMLALILERTGHRIKKEDGFVVHTDSGYIFFPQFVDVAPQEDGSISTATTIQVHHPSLLPDGVFEYQHAAGEDVVGSVMQGYAGWMQGDLVALLDVLNEQTTDCNSMEIGSLRNGKEITRRVVFGPPMQMAAEDSNADANADHNFCPCCLLTNSLDVFKPFIDADGVICLRLLAARYPDGLIEADCRVNGDEFPQGAEALKTYAKKWSGSGFEMRKQYVIVHTPTHS